LVKLKLVYNCLSYIVCSSPVLKIQVGDTLALFQSFLKLFVSIEKFKTHVKISTIASDVNLSNFTDIPSNPVALAVIV
jgi:hypothetical protein